MNGPVLFVGNPNSGKSTLFNAITGLNAKVANYPGITVEAKAGYFENLAEKKIQVIDLPGTYSLIPASEDEEITLNAIIGNLKGISSYSLIVVVIDVNELRRGLYLYSQLIELGYRVIIALNISQEIEKSEQNLIAKVISNATGTYVVNIDIKDKSSVERLKHIISGILHGSMFAKIKELPKLFENLNEELVKKLTKINLPNGFADYLRQSDELQKNNAIFFANLCHKKIFNTNLNLSFEEEEELKKLFAKLPEDRFTRVDNWISPLKRTSSKGRYYSDKIDKILLSPIFGPIILLVTFLCLMQGIFVVATPICDNIGELITALGNYIESLLPQSSILSSLVVNGIFDGLGTILAFIPLIALLFLFLAILEESGYMARITFILDHNLKKLGLCGKSVAPMISGFACAVPAIMATRTIPSKKERLITILCLPFITCSARIPVYALITGALFSHFPLIFGFINVAALMFVSMYLLGIICSLFFAFILSKTIKSSQKSALAIELPLFRFPSINVVFRKVLDKITAFAKDVGGIILAATVIMWALFNLHFSFENTQNIVQLSENNIENTLGGQIGQKLEPIFRPMGVDGKVGIAILASFLAREVFVSSMGVAYGIQETDQMGIKNAFKENITPLAGFCLLIFFTLALQCMSTVIITRRETGSFLWASFQLVFMTSFAYLLSISIYGIFNY